MAFLSNLLIVLGLCVFEVVSSIDNAIINADILSRLDERSRRWFLLWGIFIAVFLVRGLLPWLIVWFASPGLDLSEAFSATFSGDPAAMAALGASANILFVGGGLFLILLFFRWLFIEPKNYGLGFERILFHHKVLFGIMTILLTGFLVTGGLVYDYRLSVSALIGMAAFFIMEFIKNRSESHAKSLHNKGLPMIGVLLSLEMIDASFSIDGVLGALAFTLSIPLILIGNGLGALIVRQFTVGNITRIKRYVYLKNGAMYSILVLGLLMVADGFGYIIPPLLPVISTLGIVGFFLVRSLRYIREHHLTRAHQK
jgi:hypothetical protein